LAGAARTRLAVERLNVLGSLLMIGAHPDDENTALLAYFARGRHMRTAYLALTRGEGGQNLIGSEQGALLGVIRTQELLAARRIDGAEQYFTRAIDFGFSKSAEETLSLWGRERILGDVVWVIRRFQPDVIVLCSSPTGSGGHGHHQASGILGQEAFAAAADPKRFPEQLRWVEPWQAKRLVQQMYRGGAGEVAGAVGVDTGEYNAWLGHSYAEIAGMSRSMHRSQGFGAAERRGAQRNFLVHVAGEPAAKDVFDGIDTSWNRAPGGAEAGRLLAEAARTLDAEQPEEIIPLLAKARPLVARLKHPWATRKLVELDEAIALCAGLWLDAAADRQTAVPGSKLTVRATVLNRSRAGLRLEEVELAPGDRSLTVAARKGADGDTELRYNQPETRELSWKVPPEQAYSEPFWLAEPAGGFTYNIPDQKLVGEAENPPVLAARFRVRYGEETLELVRPVLYRYVDRVEGEQTRPPAIVPPASVRLPVEAYVFASGAPRRIEVEVRSNVAGAAGEVRLELPRQWSAEPAARPFQLAEAGEQATATFEVTPPAASGTGVVQAVAHLTSPPQTRQPRARAGLTRVAVQTLARRVGYVMGAGDEVPDVLRQIGCEVRLLEAEDLARGDLSRFDAIVAGVRAYNVRADLRANQARLLEWVQRGGTLVVQYNVADFGGAQSLGRLGPYPLRLGRDRVTREDAPVTFPNPDSPLLKTPNPITAADFEGWVQERGLYFAAEWDPRYQSLLESHDPGEPPRPGGTLYTGYGDGAYVFTAYAWFRQLPAGVPGGLRLFANLLSAGQTLR
jgi:LmbE family N-acetylglucosaminyl deacetylase